MNEMSRSLQVKKYMEPVNFDSKHLYNPSDTHRYRIKCIFKGNEAYFYCRYVDYEDTSFNYTIQYLIDLQTGTIIESKFENEDELYLLNFGVEYKFDDNHFFKSGEVINQEVFEKLYNVFSDKLEIAQNPYGLYESTDAEDNDEGYDLHEDEWLGDIEDVDV